MCLVVVFVVFIHAYQVTPQWKAYDDIFRGRTNAAGTICWLPLRKQVWLSERYWLFFPVQKTPLETTGTPTHLSLSVSGPFDICAITLMMKVMQRLNCLRRQKSVKPKNNKLVWFNKEYSSKTQRRPGQSNVLCFVVYSMAARSPTVCMLEYLELMSLFWNFLVLLAAEMCSQEKVCCEQNRKHRSVSSVGTISDTITFPK